MHFYTNINIENNINLIKVLQKINIILKDVKKKKNCHKTNKVLGIQYLVIKDLTKRIKTIYWKWNRKNRCNINIVNFEATEIFKIFSISTGIKS